MAESVETQRTSLQSRILQKQIDDLQPAAKARKFHILLLQGLRRSTDPVPAP